MNINPKSNLNTQRKENISPVHKRRVLDSKDIDFIIQHYVYNLNKQHKPHSGKEKRKKKLVSFLAVLSSFLLVFMVYQAWNKFGTDKSVSLNPPVEKTKDVTYNKPEQAQKPLFVLPKHETIIEEKLNENKVETFSVSQEHPKVEELLKTLEYPQIVKPDIDKKTEKAETTKKELEEEKKTSSEVKSVIPVLEEKEKIEESQPAFKLPAITLEKIEICKSIKNLKPVGINDTFSSKRVYCWIRLKAEKTPYRIHFTFFYEGRWIYRYSSMIRRKEAVTWCYKTIWDSGNWKVEITDANEKLLGSKTFFHKRQ